MRKGVLCLASGSWDGAIHLYAIKTGKHQASFHVRIRLSCCWRNGGD